MQTDEILNLENLGRGAVTEIFERQLQKVLKDIDDPNTDPRAKREINIKVVFIPTGHKGIIGIQVAATPKFGPDRVFETTVLSGRGASGRMEAREMYQQRELEFDNVTSIDKES